MRKQSDLFLPCRTLPDLESCLAAPLHSVPTVEFTVRNFDLPLDNTDYQFLMQNEINLFATDAQAAAPGRMSRSAAMSDYTLTFDTPFVMMGLCIFAYGEPYGTLVEGNTFGPQASILSLPASPLTLRNQDALLAGLLGVAEEALPDPLIACPAVLDWGNPTWRAIWAFMHAFRLEMKCPSSHLDLLMSEALADIGNCCQQSEFGGYGVSKAHHIELSHRLNSRITVAGTGGFSAPPNMVEGAPQIGQDPGWFVPINAEQHADGEIVPYRLAADLSAYGAGKSEGAVEQWYRLPCPIPFVPSTKVKISLTKENGDEGYLDRMIEEMSIRRCLTPVNAALGCHFPIHEDGQAADPDGGDGCYTKYPGGKMRIGVGVKGFQVRGHVCDQLNDMIQGKTFAQIANQYPALVSPGGVVSTASQRQVCFPVGALGVGEPKEGGR